MLNRMKNKIVAGATPRTHDCRLVKKGTTARVSRNSLKTDTTCKLYGSCKTQRLDTWLVFVALEMDSLGCDTSDTIT